MSDGFEREGEDEEEEEEEAGSRMGSKSPTPSVGKRVLGSIVKWTQYWNKKSICATGEFNSKGFNDII